MLDPPPPNSLLSTATRLASCSEWSSIDYTLYLSTPIALAPDLVGTRRKK